MDRTERNQLGKDGDWEQALHLYEQVIANEDEELQIRATIKLGRVSSNVPEHILPLAVPILVELLGRPLRDSSPLSNSIPSIQEVAAHSLSRLARQGDGELASIIGQSGAVPILLRLLQQSEGRFQRVLVKYLWRIVIFSRHNRVVVVRNGGLEVLFSLFSLFEDDTRLYLLEILGAVALLREVRRVIIAYNGLPFLVESARSGSMVSRARAAQSIGLLGVTRRVRRMLVDLGVIPVLSELLQNGDNSTKLIAGNALGIIASHIDYLRPVAQAGAIPLYAALLEGPEPLGKEIAEDVFCLLAVAEVNAVSIAEHLVRILKGDNDEAKAAAADVLWDLSGYKHSVSVVRESGAIPILVELLQDTNNDVREKVSGAIAQLSYDKVDRDALADTGLIPLLIDLLQDESEELRDNSAETLINFSEDPSFHNRVSEVVDTPLFQNSLNRLVLNRASDERMVRSLRQMGIDQLTWDLDLS